MTKRLRAPAGGDEANFGTEKFRVDNDGTVTVPDEAAPDLIKTGEFVEIVPPVAPAGMALMRCGRGSASISWGGEVYEPDGGVYTVPLAAVGELGSHGLELVA